MTATKTCTRCQRTLPISEFSQYKTGPKAGYIFTRCKNCQRETVAAARRKWGTSPNSKTASDAYRIATRQLIAANTREFEQLLDAARADLGLPPSRRRPA